jgi:hypothetical protein
MGSPLRRSGRLPVQDRCLAEQFVSCQGECANRQHPDQPDHYRNENRHNLEQGASLNEHISERSVV